MDKVKIERTKLLAKVKANREQHVKEYAAAYEGYRAEAVKRLGEQFKRAKAGEKFELHFSLAQPESQADQYDTAIAMLEAGVEDVVELTREQFRELWQDQWDWSRHTKAMFANYSSLNTRRR